MSTTLTQPPRLDPKLRNAAGRRSLVGKTLDEALYVARGYQVDVVYITRDRERPAYKRPPGHVLLFVNRDNVVKGVR